MLLAVFIPALFLSGVALTVTALLLTSVLAPLSVGFIAILSVGIGDEVIIKCRDAIGVETSAVLMTAATDSLELVFLMNAIVAFMIPLLGPTMNRETTVAVELSSYAAFDVKLTLVPAVGFRSLINTGEMTVLSAMTVP